MIKGLGAGKEKETFPSRDKTQKNCDPLGHRTIPHEPEKKSEQIDKNLGPGKEKILPSLEESTKKLKKNALHLPIPAIEPTDVQSFEPSNPNSTLSTPIP